MRPTTVHIIWSESERWPTDHVCDFWDFELQAASVAMKHMTGGYIKTKVCVHFDNGDSYICRLDLGHTDTRGFQHHISMGLDFRASNEGEKRIAGWSKAMQEESARLAHIWAQMDFTRPAPSDAPRYECTPAGIQLLIPGIAPIEKPRRSNGGGAQMALF